MEIAFVITSPIFVASDGVISQAKLWMSALEKAGNNVVLVNMWEVPDWSEFDAIHLFAFNSYMADFINNISKVNSNIFLSPILDPDKCKLYYFLSSRWGAKSARLTNRFYELRIARNTLKGVFVRSNFEKSYLVNSFGYPESKVAIVGLPYSESLSSVEHRRNRDSYCFHVSLLADERKNVVSLVEAAKKFGFNLVLGGFLRDEREKIWLNDLINGYTNIKYRGYLTIDELKECYRTCSVFALPSLNEGVGIVALDAAANGANIVITNRGGPKEYYKDHASIVDPLDIDSLGRAIVDAIDKNETNYNLMQFIRSNYNADFIANQLTSAYENLLQEGL
jgi:glycosyltransferase involved in cell wall biosynthesis